MNVKQIWKDLYGAARIANRELGERFEPVTFRRAIQIALWEYDQLARKQPNSILYRLRDKRYYAANPLMRPGGFNCRCVVVPIGHFAVADPTADGKGVSLGYKVQPADDVKPYDNAFLYEIQNKLNPLTEPRTFTGLVPVDGPGLFGVPLIPVEFAPRTFQILETPRESVGPRLHTPKDCRECDGCCICRGGLDYCTTCNGGEADLPTECPGRAMTDAEMADISSGVLDFVFGSWVRRT